MEIYPDRFIYGAYWGARKESLDEVAKKCITFINNLQLFHTCFDNFFELGSSKSDALNSKVDLDSIKKYLLKRNNNINSEGFSETGFGLSLWTGQDDGYSLSVNMNIGSYSSHLKNSCVIHLPQIGEIREELLSLTYAKQILKIMVEVWSPDNAVLISRELRKNVNISNNLLGWITYKSQYNFFPIQNICNDDVIIESLIDGEVLIIPPPFNHLDSSKIETVKRINDIVNTKN